MTEKEKIRQYLIGMANAACCNKQTAKDIKEIIIPHIDSMQEEPVSEELEEAAINYMKSQNPPIWGLYDGFIAGANWKEEKMLAKAADGQIHRYYMKDDIIGDSISIDYGVEANLDVNKHNFAHGDKVKLIIIKED